LSLLERREENSCS